jgi:hypothetical protein
MAATDTPEARLDTGIAVAIGEVLAARNLTLAGGFMPLSFGDSDLLENEMAGLDELLNIFDAATTTST